MKNPLKQRILYYSLIDAEKVWKRSKDDPRLYGLGKLKENFLVDIYKITNNLSTESTLLRFLRVVISQLRVVLKSSKYNIIYAPHDTDITIILLSKYLGIIKPKIIMIGHYSFDYGPHRGFRKTLKFLQAHLLSTGVAKIVFLSEHVLRESGWFNCEWATFAPWGPVYRASGVSGSSVRGDYLLALGKMNRDYLLLKDYAVRYSHKIILLANNTDIDFSGIKNVEIIDVPRGSQSRRITRELYASCKAVLVLLEKDTDHVTGATVVSEAVSMHKPIIITRQSTNYFDVEGERIGYFVDRGSAASIEKVYTRLLNDKSFDFKNFVRNNLNYGLFEKKIFELICTF